MDFTIDSEQKALSEAVRELATRHAANADQGKDGVPTGPQPLDEKLWSDLAEMGVLALTIPEEQGGMGATFVELLLATTELGKARVQAPVAEAVFAATVLSELGSEDQQGLLEQIASGEKVVLPALYEPMRTFSLDAYDVSATQSGEAWTLSGTKAPVAGAGGAAAFVVTARTDAGTGVFLVEEATATGDSVTFDGATAQLVGTVEGAQAALQRAQNAATVALLGESLGLAETALAMTTDYLKTRKQFGVPLMTFQTLTQRAADMYVSVELARSAAQFAAMVASEGLDATDAILRARTVVGRTGRHVGEEAIQLHGGIGMTAEYAVGHCLTRLVAIEETFGTRTQALARLARSLGDHRQVDVFA